MKGAATGHHADPLVSMQVGEFVIEERIGAGGMGVVYRASHPLIGKQVAIKVLRPELVSEQQVERLLIEARSVNAIRHPGIIDIFGFGKLSDGRPYITMELLQGATLADLIRQQGRLDVGTTVWILDQMLAALGAAHRAGVVHRDLKPGNVFLAGVVEGTRTIKLVDFGIAKLLQSHDGPTTVDGAILGTPEFMSPEQIRGLPAGPAADLYAVGVIAFQMLTGARPFNGEPLQVLFAHVEQPPPLPSSRGPGIPPELDTLILHLLAKDPALRPESAEAVRQALKHIPLFQSGLAQPGGQLPEATLTLTSPSESETRTTPSMEVPWRPSHSGHWRRAVIGMALLAGLGGGVFLLRPSKTPAPGSEPTPPVALTPAATAEHVVDPPLPAVVEARPPEAPSPPAQEHVTPAQTAEQVPSTPEPEEKPSLTEESPRKGALPVSLKLPLKRKEHGGTHQRSVRDLLPTSDGAGGPDPALDEVHAAAVTPLPPAAPPPVLPREGPQPRDAKLARRLSQLEAQYQAQAEGRDASGHIARELVRLHGAAVKATTAMERMEVQRGLDAWQQHMRQGSASEPSPPKPVPPEHEVQLLVPSTSTSGSKTQERVKDLQLGLLREIEEAEQWLRARAGDTANGSPALAELQRIRQQARTAVTAQERTAVRNELSAWRRLRTGDGTQGHP